MVPTDQQLRACQAATACGIVSDFDVCIRYAADIAGSVARTGTATFGPGEVACVAHAGTDCDAALRCMNAGAAPQSCSGNGAQCDGQIVRGCLFGSTHAFDCSTVGLRCISDASGGAGCATDSCAPDGSRCDVDGATRLDCSKGVQRRIDCAHDDATCIYSGASAVCGGNGRSCQSDTMCDGDVIVSCDFGRQQRRDCAKLGLHCIVNYHPLAAFDCGNGTGCDPATRASCDDRGQLHYCYLGTPLVADCKAAGFSGCGANGCVR